MKIHATFRTIILSLLFTGTAQVWAETTDCSEPNIETAKLWWPDQRNVWTPIGWKDHYFRFNVVYNGAIVFEPYSDMSSRLHARRYKGQDFQVTFIPWPDTNFPALPQKRSMLWKLDGGHGIQGWETNHAAPVLWTDFPLQEGMVIREETFGHLQGGDKVQTGLEPLYAWVRLSVTHVDPLRAPTHFPVIAQMSKNYYAPAGHYLYENGVTIDVDPKRSAYPRKLNGVPFESNGAKGMRVLEPDGKVRFAALPSSSGSQLQFFEREPGVYALKVDLQAKEGDYIDLLMPMFPESSTNADEEMALGFDAALAQADAFWNADQEAGATFHVPENYINEAVAQSEKFVPLISEKDYETGAYSVLSGSWGYDELWPTPSSMDSHMFLSLLGCHQTVAKYSELYRRYQGTIKPPGAAYKIHPGYFGSPKYLTSIDWLADHGAVLLQVSTEALLSGDPKFIEEWTDPIIKACEFIRDNCAQTNHEGVPGLLPPAVATDEGVPMQAVWSLAWNYKGLTTAVELLKRIHHPRAEEFETLAKNYKATFVDAFRKASADAPRWKDSSGNEYPKPPTTLWPKELPLTSVTDAFYLDGGPMVLVWAGLMDADDPLMQATVKFFREGPNWKLKAARFNAICRPVLEHEISSCEPCYSWNAFYSWKLGERERYLTAMYSVFAGALSQQTYISCEHRGGMQGNLFALPLAFWLARQAVIDDELHDGELHLLRFCPLAWLSEKDPATFLHMPTIYGQVDLQVGLAPGGKTLKMHFSGKWREKPGKVIVHLPPVPNLTAVNIDGKDYPASPTLELTEY
jgi:hypothetical protein